MADGIAYALIGATQAVRRQLPHGDTISRERGLPHRIGKGSSKTEAQCGAGLST